jgi:gas vesicle protein
MKPILIAAMILAVASPVWADEEPSQQPRKESVRVQDLPKPIPELLDKIQQLSKKIEPEISRLGSTLGQELKVTVKKLCEELQCQERPESK